MLGKTLWAYLRDRWKTAALVLACAAIYALMGALFGLPAAVNGYALGLCALVWLPATAIGFARYFKKRAELHRLLQTDLLSAGELPAPTGHIERDYQALLSRQLDRLSQLDEAAIRARREQSDYYALWAHQIKVPISAMRLVLQSGTNEQSATLLSELFKVEQYIDMALNYVRLNGASTDYLIKPYPLDDIIRQTIRKFAPLFIQKKLKLTYEGTTLHVLTDEKWLSFALEQLLSNAVKYTKRGGVTITVDEQAHTLSVLDTGIGIAADDLPRVFEQGYTGYNGRADKRATGLGLYLCKRSLTKLGHDVSITSTVGRGTCAVIDLSQERIQVE